MSLLNDHHRKVRPHWPRIMVIAFNVALWLLAVRYILWAVAGDQF